MRSKRYIATGLLAGLTAGAGAGFTMSHGGIAGAAGVAAAAVATVDTTGTTETTGTSDTGEATAPPTTRAERLAEVLAPLVEDGTITQAQADAVIAALDAAGPIGGGHGHRGHHGHHGHDGHHGPHRHGGRVLRVALEHVATALGTTVEELRDSLAEGTTMRELATEAGIDPQAIVDAIVAPARTALDERVAAGDLTQEEAAAELAALTRRAAELLDSTGPLGRHRGARPDEADEADEADEVEAPGTSGSTGTSGTTAPDASGTTVAIDG